MTDVIDESEETKRRSIWPPYGPSHEGYSNVVAGLVQFFRWPVGWRTLQARVCSCLFRLLGWLLKKGMHSPGVVFSVQLWNTVPKNRLPNRLGVAILRIYPS